MGWFAVEKRSVVSVSANNSCQKSERNRASRSEMMLRGNPCMRTMLSRKSLASCGASALVVVGIKCAILVNLSTMTKIAS